MPCACNKGKATAGATSGQSSTLVKKHRVQGTGNPLVDKIYDSETEAQMALAKSGKTGTVRPV